MKIFNSYFRQKYKSFAVNEDLRVKLAIKPGAAGSQTFLPFTATNREDTTITDAFFRSGRKHTLVAFWASWCAPCLNEMPTLREMNDRLGKRLQLISVSIDSRSADYELAVKQLSLPWTQVHATEQMISKYGIKAIPVYLVVDPEGKIVSSHDNLSGDNGVISRLNEEFRTGNP